MSTVLRRILIDPHESRWFMPSVSRYIQEFVIVEPEPRLSFLNIASFFARQNQGPVSASSVPGMNVETRCPRFEGQTGLKQQFCVPSVEMNGESFRLKQSRSRRRQPSE